MKHPNAFKTIAACARPCLAGALLLAASLPALAHVTLEYQVANAGSYYKGTFKVGHGCGSSPVKQIVVTIPAGVQGAKPMPKPGWRIAIEKAGDKVTRITWTASTPEDKLSSEHYDEFVVVARTPAEPGPVYWPVVQVCDEGRGSWVEVPAPGQKFSDLKAPAARLEVLPAAGTAHQHKH